VHSTAHTCGALIKFDFRAIPRVLRCPHCQELVAPPQPPAMDSPEP
jgi:hypothetical protein